MKKCPYCAEEIQEEAIVCKHCGRELIEKPKKNPPGTAIAGIGLGIILISCLFTLIPAFIDGSSYGFSDPSNMACFGLGGILLVMGLVIRVFQPK